jgi:hypothetical protein
MIRTLLVMGLMLVLTACNSGSGPGPLSGSAGSSGGSGGTLGGGGGGGTTSANSVTVTVDGGPVSGVDILNAPYVSVTVCAPGTSNCQTIDHVTLDTGSVGLRILDSVLSATLLNALPKQTDASGNPVGECYGYVDGYVFGSVRSADFKIGSESVSSMPIQVITSSGTFADPPASCASGGGSDLNTVSLLGANGVLGIGVMATDCATLCATGSGTGAATYFDCGSSSCATVITRAASTVAPFQQLPNPVAALDIDNNGTVIVLPSAPATGEASLTGTLYLGIGTRSNNSLQNATILTTTDSTNAEGAGLLTATFNGINLTESFVDSGSSLYFFDDTTIPLCTQQDLTSYYCPTSPLTLTATLVGQNAATVVDMFTLYNAETTYTGDAVAPGLGGSLDVQYGTTNNANSFDFGLPFFYGRSVYTAIEGRPAAGVNGPYVAF